MGPDGAIYIADWYNPIIQHGEVDFRDPRRDVTHGRIWRITAKGRPLVPRPQLVNAKTTEDCSMRSKEPEDWTRQQARMTLKERGAKAVLPALHAWETALDASKPVEPAPSAQSAVDVSGAGRTGAALARRAVAGQRLSHPRCRRTGVGTVAYTADESTGIIGLARRG